MSESRILSMISGVSFNYSVRKEQEYSLMSKLPVNPLGVLFVNYSSDLLYKHHSDSGNKSLFLLTQQQPLPNTIRSIKPNFTA